MAGEVFSWLNDGFDLHVLATTPVELAQILRVRLTPGAAIQPWSNFIPPASPPPGVTVVFTTLSKTFTKAVHGITVNGLSGRVDSDPNPKVRNFIVTATIKGNDATDPNKTQRMSIRIFLHDSLSRVQLSPATLHIPAGIQQSFSVLGVFSDGSAEGNVVGDLTHYPPLSWATSGGNTIDITVDAITGVVQANANPQSLNQSAKVQVTLPTTYGAPARIGTADAFPVQSWDRDVEVKPVGEASLDNYQNTANVLFLPDGFTDGAGEKRFNQAVEILAGQLRSNRSAHPFGLFIGAKSLNIFKAWIPSTDDGGTVLDELHLKDSPATREVPIPRDPTTLHTPGIDDLNDLVWAVGLPTKTRAAQTSFSSQVDEWNTLFGFPAATPDLEKLWENWKELYPRFFAAERDTAFGCAYGGRPQVTDLTVDTDMKFNETARTARHEIDPLLTRLYLKKEAPLPVAQRIGRRFVTNGPDTDRIFIIINGPFDAGEATTVIMSTLSSEKGAVAGSVPSDGEIITLRAVEIIDNTLSPEVRATAAHEIGHTFHLGDEYSDIIENLPADEDISDFWNLHTAGEVGTPINAGNIRWGIGTPTNPGWVRLKAAAVLQELPTVMSSAPNLRVRIPVTPDHFFRAVGGLLPGTLFRLRRRPLVGTYTQQNPLQSDLITLDAVVVDDQVVEGVVTDAASAQRVQGFVESLTINLVDPSTVIVAVPRLNLAGAEQGIMHARIGQLMQVANTPLNRKQAAACELTEPPFVQSPVLFVPDQFLPLRYITRVVGLFDGGDSFRCGVYHPQGLCLMRSVYPRDVSAVGRFFVKNEKPELAEFCAVCRYILVDTIDPSFHGAIDDEYEKQYPVLR